MDHIKFEKSLKTFSDENTAEPKFSYSVDCRVLCLSFAVKRSFPRPWKMHSYPQIAKKFQVNWRLIVCNFENLAHFDFEVYTANAL